MPTYPLGITYADLRVGMPVQAVTTWAGSGATCTITGTVTAVTPTTAALSTGDYLTPAAAPDQTVTLTQTAAYTAPPTEPAVGTCGVDETGKLWQRTGSPTISDWRCVTGTVTTWAGFLAAGHTLTALTAVTPGPLPAPATGYPVTITAGAARIGMDARVTITTPGGSKVIRSVVVWNQDNAEPAPDYLRFGLATGEVVQYNPVEDGVSSLLVEQMNAWADAGQGVGVTEFAVGKCLLSAGGVAWQCVGTATSDGPFYLTGQKLWRPVYGDDTQTRAWIWFWGAAAPYKELA